MWHGKSGCRIGLLSAGLLAASVLSAAPLPANDEAAAATAFQRGQYHQAIARYEKLLRRQPNKVALRARLAESYEISGDLEQARANAGEVLKQRDNDVGALLVMGRIHGRQQDWGAAKVYYERAVIVDRANASAHLGLSQALMALGDGAGAERALRAYKKLTNIPGR